MAGKGEEAAGQGQEAAGEGARRPAAQQVGQAEAAAAAAAAESSGSESDGEAPRDRGKPRCDSCGKAVRVVRACWVCGGMEGWGVLPLWPFMGLSLTHPPSPYT